MDIVLNVLRVLLSLFMGLLLYFGITGLILGSTFVIRESLMFLFNIDLYEKLKELAEKIRAFFTPKPQPPLTESDAEWLKNRGRY